LTGSEHCPICQVPVKPVNLLRHVQDNHPRHPEAVAVVQRIQEESRRAPRPRPARPLTLPRKYIAIAVAVVLLAAGIYVLAPYLVSGSRVSPHTCVGVTQVVHIHPRLSIVVFGSRFPIPYNIGIESCHKLLHTHENPTPPEGYVPDRDPAVIHVESHVRQDFYLSDFFSVWGQVLSPTQVLGYANDGTNVLTMTVDGFQSPAFGDLVLADGQAIALTYGPAL